MVKSVTVNTYILLGMVQNWVSNFNPKNLTKNNTTMDIITLNF